MKILVVNENRAAADWIASLFNNGGHHHALALYDSSEALRHASQISFQAAIISKFLGDALGANLGAKLRAMMPRCALVVLAKQIMVPQTKLRTESDYLSTLFEPEDRMDRINEALNELRAMLEKFRLERLQEPKRRKRALKRTV